MRVLIIKMSSLGDVVHTLPAITDACANIPGIEFDWVVEESFAEIPSWHPGVKNVIPIAWRRWRKTLLKVQTRREMRVFFQQLRSQKYDLIIDAQGLIKSAIVTRLAKGKSCGLDKRSAREGLASNLYNTTANVLKGQHAVSRTRKLLATCLGYNLAESELDYGLTVTTESRKAVDKPYLLFLHGTTWETKLWPETYWRTLAKKAAENGFNIFLPWGSDTELQRATRIANGIGRVQVLQKSNLMDIKILLKNAHAVVGVDTGLSHIAAAVNVPTIGIYGATDATLTGITGQQVQVMSSSRSCAPCLSQRCQFEHEHHSPKPPCYHSLSPEQIWLRLSRYLARPE